MPNPDPRVPVARTLAVVLALAGAGVAGCQGGSATSSGPAAGSAAAATSAAGAGSAAVSTAEPGSAPDVPGATPYDRDIDRICDVERLSGALEQPEGGRQLAIAQWLPGALETEDAHAFLVEIGTLGPDQKAAALDAEAKKAGLTGCPLARVWHK
jgi:hypothetical protein